MSVLSQFGDRVRLYRESLRRRHTERMINRMPIEIRKDIGWPVNAHNNRLVDGHNNALASQTK